MEIGGDRAAPVDGRTAGCDTGHWRSTRRPPCREWLWAGRGRRMRTSASASLPPRPGRKRSPCATPCLLDAAPRALAPGYAKLEARRRKVAVHREAIGLLDGGPTSGDWPGGDAARRETTRPSASRHSAQASLPGRPGGSGSSSAEHQPARRLKVRQAVAPAQRVRRAAPIQSSRIRWQPGTGAPLPRANQLARRRAAPQRGSARDCWREGARTDRPGAAD